MAFGPTIKASIGADTTPLKEDAAKAEGIIGGFAAKTKSLLGEVGSGIVGAFGLKFAADSIGSFFRGVYEDAKGITLLSRELGVGAESLQAFKNVVEDTGDPTENLRQLWEKARDTLDGLRAGEAGATDAFAKLGLAASDFIGLGLDESLEKIARAYVENKDEAGAYGALLDILGKKNVPQLIEALEKLGNDGFAKARADAEGFFESIGPGALSAFDNLRAGGKAVLEFLSNGFANTFGHIISGISVLARTLRNFAAGQGLGEAFENASSEEAAQLKGEADAREAENAKAAAAQRAAAADAQSALASQQRLAAIREEAKWAAAGADRDERTLQQAREMLALEELAADEEADATVRAQAQNEADRIRIQLLDRIGEMQRELARGAEQSGFQADTFGIGQTAEAAAGFSAPDAGDSSLQRIHGDLVTISQQLRNAGLN